MRLSTVVGAPSVGDVAHSGMIDRRTLLPDDEIAIGLERLSGWARSGEHLRAEFIFPDFVQAFSFMTAVALIAEKLDHHPDWSNVYGRVVIGLTNHDAGGITELDLHLASRINEVAEGRDQR